MNSKKLVINSLLLAIGAILHQITPPIVLGIKPDFSLAMLFIIVLLNEDYKSCISAGIITGILSAATTAFPGGQLPNLIDKFITANAIFLILYPIRKTLNNQVKIVTTAIVGTLISGTVFLFSALIIVGLPASFKFLFLSVVLPSTVLNVVASVFLFNIVNIALKRRSII